MLNFNITNQTVPEIKTILVKNGKWQLVKKQNLSDPHLNDQLKQGVRGLLTWMSNVFFFTETRKTINYFIHIQKQN